LHKNTVLDLEQAQHQRQDIIFAFPFLHSSWRRKLDARRTWGGVGTGASNNLGDNDDNDGNDDYINADDGLERLQNLLPLQQHILSRAARLVKPGGRLV